MVSGTWCTTRSEINRPQVQNQALAAKQVTVTKAILTVDTNAWYGSHQMCRHGREKHQPAEQATEQPQQNKEMVFSNFEWIFFNGLSKADRRES